MLSCRLIHTTAIPIAYTMNGGGAHLFRYFESEDHCKKWNVKNMLKYTCPLTVNLNNRGIKKIRITMNMDYNVCWQDSC